MSQLVKIIWSKTISGVAANDINDANMNKAVANVKKVENSKRQKMTSISSTPRTTQAPGKGNPFTLNTHSKKKGY